MAEINEEGIIVSDNTLYVPQTWIDEVDACTPLSAENLNRMVLGMCNIAERCDSLSQTQWLRLGGGQGTPSAFIAMPAAGCAILWVVVYHVGHGTPMVMQKTTLDELRAHSASGPLRVLAAVEPQTYFCEVYAQESTIYIKNGGASFSCSYIYGARLSV